MPKQSAVPRPMKKSEYVLKYATKQSEKGWRDLDTRVGPLTIRSGRDHRHGYRDLAGITARADQWMGGQRSGPRVPAGYWSMGTSPARHDSATGVRMRHSSSAVSPRTESNWSPSMMCARISP